MPYLEKPAGPIEVLVEKHNYNVAWVNPANGERTVMKKFNAEKFVGEPPSRDHDWVLHLEREGRKAGMLNSYKFESRAIEMQEIEQDPSKVPFAVGEPAVDTTPASYAKLLRAEYERYVKLIPEIGLKPQ